MFPGPHVFCWILAPPETTNFNQRSIEIIIYQILFSKRLRLKGCKQTSTFSKSLLVEHARINELLSNAKIKFKIGYQSEYVWVGPPLTTQS